MKDLCYYKMSIVLVQLKIIWFYYLKFPSSSYLWYEMRKYLFNVEVYIESAVKLVRIVFLYDSLLASL